MMTGFNSAELEAVELQHVIHKAGKDKTTNGDYETYKLGQ
jgi:hypothetical protein